MISPIEFFGHLRWIDNRPLIDWKSADLILDAVSGLGIPAGPKAKIE